MTTTPPTDPAVTMALVALGRQRESLTGALADLGEACQLFFPRPAESWIGLAERAHDSALADLRDVVDAATTSLEHARVHTSTAIDELNARV